MDAIEVRDATKTYGDVTALDGLSLSVESGTAFGLLGTNGAGKTTLFKLLVGHLRPDEGSVSVVGRNVETAGPSVREQVGYLPEHAGFPPSLTGREVLEFHAKMRGLPADERADRIADTLETVGLSEAADRAVTGYSNGMNRRLGLATALLARPGVLLLDEPTAGLDPQGVATFHRIVERLRDETDLTLVVSSHVLGEIERLCEEVAVVHDGELRASGSIDELRRECGDSVTVRARLAQETDREAAVDAVRPRAETLRTDGRVVEATCPRSAATELVDALDEAVGLDGFEVREPGLDAVFDRALGAEESPDSPADPEVVAP
ncbi:ABC transporter ATP-binding protein [Halorussus salinisoli]|uniref:ABC transporter ATP-binding protein n=1 Tax=Halorussus salinisoli TaxID=2558242 RepID=UPI0010C1BE35|nr:ABC transporter ATP-binding protein [Halorussus salinisoli]